MPEENALNYAAEQSDSFICTFFVVLFFVALEAARCLATGACPKAKYGIRCTCGGGYWNRMAIGWKSFTAQQKFEESDNSKSYCQRQPGKNPSRNMNEYFIEYCATYAE